MRNIGKVYILDMHLTLTSSGSLKMTANKTSLFKSFIPPTNAKFNIEDAERYIVSAYYPSGGFIEGWTRVYKTRTGAEKRFAELINDYEVNAKMKAWFSDFSESKSGKFVLVKKDFRYKEDL